MRTCWLVLFLVGCSREAPTAKPLNEPSKPAVAKPTPSAEPPKCIDVESEAKIELTGVVDSGTHSHPNGTSFKFYVLKLASARCAKGLDDKTVDEVQLTSPDGVKLDPYVGKKVRVVGTALAGLTAWYVRPAAIAIESIAEP